MVSIQTPLQNGQRTHPEPQANCSQDALVSDLDRLKSSSTCLAGLPTSPERYHRAIKTCCGCGCISKRYLTPNDLRALGNDSTTPTDDLGNQCPLEHCNHVSCTDWQTMIEERMFQCWAYEGYTIGVLGVVEYEMTCMAMSVKHRWRSVPASVTNGTTWDVMGRIYGAGRGVPGGVIVRMR